MKGTERDVSHQNRLPREVSPSLEGFKSRVDVSLVDVVSDGLGSAGAMV